MRTREIQDMLSAQRVAGATGAGVLVLLIAWNFIYFWPLYTGIAIPIDDWRSRMWLDTWV